MQIRIVHPQAERVLADLASKNYIEFDEPEETLKSKFRRWRLESDELQMREGPPFEEPPLSMKEIVAICKEVRTEMYTGQRRGVAAGK
jgi:hypothetical protein